ncbi:MAG: heavy metal sensor histidine kinase [Burkholderiales bacterium]|nr:heavy metal sensor histidine kinase [Burkholderiales bacterium]
MRSLQPVSLATLLGFLFAATTALVFSLAGFHLYQSLIQQLQAQDDETLLSTVDLLRHQLEELEGGVEAIRADPHRLLDVVLGQNGMFLALRDHEGTLLAASSGGAALLPTEYPVAVSSNPDPTAIRDWRGSDGKRGRAVTAWARIGQEPDSRILIVLAFEDLGRAALLKAYREDLLWTTLAGIFATMLLGYMMAHRGLRPLRTMAKMAGRITVNKLEARLRIEDAPSELREMVHAFNRMLDRLEDSFQRLTQFSSDIAHDLRTPICNLMIETQVTLTQPRSAAEYEALLSSNIEEYERLTRMIENLLFLARADNAQIALRRSAISIDVELKHIAEYFEGMAEEAGIVLDVDARGDLIADTILFQRAVSNLLTNAIRHTAPGQRITIRGYQRSVGEYVIEVGNPGDGIPPGHLTRLFDRFYRIDVSRGESQSSSGLGLAIVKSIMDLHGGSVEVESIPNGITTFRLIFSA